MNEGEKTNTPTPSGGNFEASQPERPRTNFVGSRRYHGPSEEDRYNAASNLASDPNTPEFFGDAMMSYTPAPQPKKNRKWLIIGVIIFVVVIVGVIAALVLSGNKTGSRLGAKNISEAFNLFGNYMLNGEESVNPLPESIELNSYTSYRIGYVDSSDNAEEKEAYYAKLYEYYENLKKYYDEADKSKYDPDIISDESIKYLGDVVEFLRTFDETDQKTNTDIYVYYRNNGEESTGRYINNIFDSYINSENTVIQGYFSIKYLAAEEMYNLSKYVDKAKCLEAAATEKCLAESGEKVHQEAMNIRQSVKDHINDAEEYHKNILDIVLIRTIEMSNSIKASEKNDA